MLCIIKIYGVRFIHIMEYDNTGTGPGKMAMDFSKYLSHVGHQNQSFLSL